MKKYGYWLTQSFSTYVEVEAQDKDEAENQVQEMVCNGWVSALDEEPDTSITFDKEEEITQ